MIFNQKMVNHAKASMILVVMLDPSMTVRPVKLTLSSTGSHTFFSFFFIMGGMPPWELKTELFDDAIKHYVTVSNYG